MNKDLQAQYQRLMSLQSEAQYIERGRAERAQRIIAGIAAQSADDIAAAKSLVPAVTELRNFTEESLLKNIDGSCDICAKIFNDLYAILKNSLDEFEGQL